MTPDTPTPSEQNSTPEGRAENARRYQALRPSVKLVLDRLMTLDTVTCKHQWQPLEAGMEVCVLCRVVKIDD